MASSVCRVCLAGNVKMLNISIMNKNHLLQMFEKLTDSKLNTESETGIPSTVCYICHRQLQRCHMFSELARSSEQTMFELLRNNIQITYSTISMLSPAVPTLSITSTQHVSIINDTTATSTVTGKKEKYIKQEKPLNESQVLDFTSATVKEELVTINLELEEETGFESLQTSSNTVEEKNDLAIEWTTVEEEKNDLTTSWTIIKEEKKDMEIEESVCESLPTSWNTVEEETKDLGIEKPVCESLPITWAIVEEENNYLEINESGYESLPINCTTVEEETKDLGMEEAVCESLPTSWTIIEEEKKDLEINWATVEEEKKDLVIEDTKLIYKESLVTSKNAATLNPKESNIENFTNTEHQPRIDSYLYCNICNRKFEFKYQKDKHLKYCKRKKKTHPCTICGRVYSSYNYLSIHMRTHTGDKPYSCNECDKKFIGKVHLRRHVKLHKEGTSNCNVCDETFNCKTEFVKHMSSHTVMTLPCNQCGKTFNNQRDYTSHIQIHSLEKLVNTNKKLNKKVQL